jgi:hypothetical protein
MVVLTRRSLGKSGYVSDDGFVVSDIEEDIEFTDDESDDEDYDDYASTDKPIKIQLNEEFLASVPEECKELYVNYIKQLNQMSPNNSEYFKLKQWCNTFERIPFGTYNTFPFENMTHAEKCKFIQDSRDIMDNVLFGHVKAKEELVCILVKWLMNPQFSGQVIGLHGSPGVGKCFSIDTPILMHDGSIKKVQDIKVGDQLMGDDSTSRNVQSLGGGQDQMYSIVNTRGVEYTVNSEHILCLRYSKSKSIIDDTIRNNRYCVRWFDNQNIQVCSKTFKYTSETKKQIHQEALQFLDDIQEDKNCEITVKEYLKLGKIMKKNLKGYQVPIEFASKKTAFDPYIIGAWLGDGTSNGVGFTNQDSAILHYIANTLPKYNCYLQHQDNNGKSDIAYRMNGMKHLHKNSINSLLIHLRESNLINNKHIPVEYKCNSKEVRLQLLAGIIDTDGSVTNKCYDLIQKNEKLADDIVYLCRSLGFACYKRECRKGRWYNGEYKEGEYFRLTISGVGIETIPCKVSRKIIQGERSHFKDALVSGIKVIPVYYGDYYGFEIDGNKKFMLGNFIVTHNTELARHVLSPILQRPIHYISLAGATDGSFLNGFSITYEGSRQGAIVDGIIQSKCMNPILFFDEVDKVSESAMGREIIGKLINLTDPNQNGTFSDHYFHSVPFDLSKAIIVFSFNDIKKIDRILLDRIKVIEMNTFTHTDKIELFSSHLMKSMLRENNFKDGEIIFTKNAINDLVHRCPEDGVRNLKRKLDTVLMKLNVLRFSPNPELSIDFSKTIHINTVMVQTLLDS